MSFGSKKTMFVFKQDASAIEDRPFEWDKYAELADGMTNEQLVDFILSEMNAFQ